MHEFRLFAIKWKTFDSQDGAICELRPPSMCCAGSARSTLAYNAANPIDRRKTSSGPLLWHSLHQMVGDNHAILLCETGAVAPMTLVEGAAASYPEL